VHGPPRSQKIIRRGCIGAAARLVESNRFFCGAAIAPSRIACLRASLRARRIASPLEQTASALEREIEIEQARTGIRDPGDIAYSMYAKATIVPRDNLKCSITDLKERLAVAKISLTELSHDAQKRKQSV
jgi:hypothetical protein